MPSYVVECSCGCGTFEAKSPRAKWASPGCKKRSQRESAAAAAGTSAGDPTAGLKPEDELVIAVRTELGDKVSTVDGQIAIHLARQVKAATGSSASSLAKELRVVLDRVVPPPPFSPTPAAASPTKDDEVEAARKRREAKAAAAAGTP